MTMRHFPFLLMLLLLTWGCAEPVEEMRSTDERIDFVIEEDMERTARCLEIVKMRMLRYSPAPGSGSAELYPRRFQGEEVRQMATLVAEGRGKSVPVEITGVDVNPQRAGFQCNAAITRPVEIGDISFVQFSAPNGLLGAYAFRRGTEGWHPVERVRLGHW